MLDPHGTEMRTSARLADVGRLVAVQLWPVLVIWPDQRSLAASPLG
jgi:hypothetical protein